MKNKYQESIDYLKDFSEGDNITITCDFCENVNKLYELVKKEIPAKVKIMGYDEDWLSGLRIAYGKCPECDFSVCDDEFYCRNCGQRIYFEYGD